MIWTMLNFNFFKTETKTPLIEKLELKFGPILEWTKIEA
jgi:hypothetical protein